jgi:predicted GH43/DUF377 family glycosyl hydrolase
MSNRCGPAFLGLVVAAASALLTLAASPGTSRELDDRVNPRHPSNPVLGPGPGDWDGHNVLHCAVLRDDDGYKMYYTGEARPGYAFRSIGLAVSRDGVHWEKHPNNPLIAPSRNIQSDEFDNVHCHTPTVLYRRDATPRYQMWYSGYQDNSGNRIGYAHSDDGVRWVRLPKPVIDYGKPGEFDDAGLRSPEVAIHPTSGEYWMWYNGTRKDQHYGPTGLAVSRDGTSWERRGKLCDDESRLLYGEVVYDAPARLFRMWHDLGPDITYAASRDGLRWQDLDGTPLLRRGAPYDRHYCQAPSVIFDAARDAYLVYYNGATGDDPNQERVTINLAVFSRRSLDTLPLKPNR